MKRGVVCLLMLLAIGGTLQAQQHGTGYIPGSTDVCEIEQAWTSVGLEPKGTQFDWRNNGGNFMFTVEDQQTTNLCWTFSSLHCLTSQIKIDEGISFNLNFSEDAMADCSLPGGPTYGGNNWKAGGYLSAMGPVLQTCQPWNPGTTNCLACPQQDYRLRKMRTIASSTAAIKAALVDGPVATSMDVDGVAGGASAFNSYNGTYVLANGSPGTETDHGVIIIGWHEGTAGSGYLAGDYWICKNSWGTGWGDGGYFYIAYGAALIGSGACQFIEWEPSLESQEKVLLYEDDNGADGYIDATQSVIYICQRLTPTMDGQIDSIQWVNTGNNFNWEIRIYDNFSGTAPLTLIGGPYTGTSEPYGGIITYDLPDTVNVTSGDQIYVCIRLHNPTDTIHPICLSGPYSNGGWISFSAITSGYQTNAMTGIPYDWSIRAVIFDPSTDVPATGWIGLIIMIAAVSALIIWMRRS